MKKLAAFLLCIVILLTLCTGAFAEYAELGESNHFNVMLVVDATGSMRNSDPTGLRYDALKLFLGLLTEKGNNVGAVVFDDKVMLDKKPSAMNKMADKLNLAREIENKGIGKGSTTNIVEALETAVADLKGMTQQNGLPSVVLLLTDGNDNTLKAEVANKKKEEILTTARNEGISIYSVLLDFDGKGNPGAISDYSDLTGGIFTEVSSAEGLSNAFRNFYVAINNVEYKDTDKKSFDANGNAEVIFQVPAFGVEEVNIVIDKTDPLDSIDIVSPSKGYDKFAVESLSMNTRRYKIVKVAAPEGGFWTVKLKGTPGGYVDVKMMFSCTYTGELQCLYKGKVTSDDDSYEYLHNVEYTFDCTVTDPGMTLTTDHFKTLESHLYIKHIGADEEVIEMEPTKTGYTANYKFEQGAYEAFAVIGLGSFSKRTNTVRINVENKPPVSGDNIKETIKTGLFHEGKFEFKLSDYFSDPEGKPLDYSFDGKLKDYVRRDGDKIIIDCNGIEKASMTVSAADEFGAETSIHVELTENNVTAKYVITAAAVLAAIIAAIIAYLAWRNSLKCTLEIVMTAFNSDTDEYSNLTPVFSFHGKCPLSKLGELFGASAKDCWLEASKDRNLCYFRSKKPFSYGGSKTKKAEIRDGSMAKIYFGDNTCGLEVEANKPSDF